MGEKYHFGGWATRYNVRCSDGRTIRQNAFVVEKDGTLVIGNGIGQSVTLTVGDLKALKALIGK